MPITQSAKKALRQSRTRREQNNTKKDVFRALVKNVRSLTAEKKLDEARALLPRVYQALDKATKTGVIKRNMASRLKSRLTKKLTAKN